MPATPQAANAPRQAPTSLNVQFAETHSRKRFKFGMTLSGAFNSSHALSCSVQPIEAEASGVEKRADAAAVLGLVAVAINTADAPAANKVGAHTTSEAEAIVASVLSEKYVA
jgi:hypothetical protein